MSPHRRNSSTSTLFSRPLRDALRGVGAAWDATEDLLDPVAPLIPSRLRDGFKSAVEKAERAAIRTLSPPPPVADIACAAAFLKGEVTDGESADIFVRVWAHAVDHAAGIAESGHFMMSEMVAASALGRAGEGKTGYARAASILLEMRRAHSAGSIPGTPINLSPQSARNAELTLFAAALWLLAKRETDSAEELRVFRLALTLARTLEAQVIGWFADEAALADGLASLERNL